MDRLVYDFNELCDTDFAVVHCNLKILQELFNISENELETFKEDIITDLKDADPMSCDCLFILYWPEDGIWNAKLIHSSKDKITNTKLIDDITAVFTRFFSGRSYTEEFQEKITNLTNNAANKVSNNTSETEFIKPLKLFK